MTFFLSLLQIIALVCVSARSTVASEAEGGAAAAARAAISSSTSASTSTTSLEGRLLFADLSPFNETTRITLNHNEYTTYSRFDGSFTIYNIPIGIHQLDVHSTKYLFSTVKIQILAENIGYHTSMDMDMESDMNSDTANVAVSEGGNSDSTSLSSESRSSSKRQGQPVPPKCLEYPYVGSKKLVISCAPYLSLTTHATYQYFEVKRGFSIVPILKNPMVLMMGFSALMMFAMPKMMENMDPEEKATMQKQMEMQKDPTKMLSQLWGDISGAADEPAQAAIGGGGGGRGKRAKGKR